MTINGDGSTVVEYHYTRNSYQLTFTPGTPDADIVRTVVYGGQTAPPTVARAGYTFAGWYDNAPAPTRLRRNHHAGREPPPVCEVDGQYDHRRTP